MIPIMDTTEDIYNGTPKAEALAAWEKLKTIINRAVFEDEIATIESYLQTSFEFSLPGIRSALSQTKRGKRQSEAAARASRENATKPAAPGKRRGRPFKDPDKQAEAVRLYQEQLQAQADG
jgi:hypothetical protein